MDVQEGRTDDVSNPLQPEGLTNAFEEAELHDLTTTIDPSHVIRLIRQLLPESHLRRENAVDIAKDSSDDGRGCEKICGEGVSEGRGNGAGGGSGGECTTLPSIVPDDTERGNTTEESAEAACASGAARAGGLADKRSAVVELAAADIGGAQVTLTNSLGQEVSKLARPKGSGTILIGEKRAWDDGEPPDAEMHVVGNTQDQQELKEQQMERHGGADLVEGEGVEGCDFLAGGQESSRKGKPTDSGSEKERPHSEGGEDPREEAGCVLWDLAANRARADFLVENHILEVLMAILQAPHSNRMREVALGILGNLACHPVPEQAMVRLPGLVDLVVRQLLEEHPPSLTETCRLLSAGLHSDQSAAWVAALDSEEVLGRIMWMAANTMHAQLLEKSAELLLAMVDGRRDTASPLLPGLLRLGLPELLTDLLTSELTAVTEGTSSHGDLVLDMVLQVTEALSLSDDCAEQLAANRKLFTLACQVVRLSGKDEIGPSGVTAAVLVANLLEEDMALIQSLAHDMVMASRLLALMPVAGDDPGARNAIWSILGRMCRIQTAPTNGEDPFWLVGMAAVLAEGCHLVLEDLEEHREEDMEEDEDRAQAGHDVAASTSRGLQAKLVTASNMILIMEHWSKASSQANGHTEQLQSATQAACTQLQQFLAVNQLADDGANVRQDTATTANMPSPHSQSLEAAF